MLVLAPPRICMGVATLVALHAVLSAYSQAVPPDGGAVCEYERDTNINWAAAKIAMWKCVDARVLSDALVSELAVIMELPSACSLGLITAAALVSTHAASSAASASRPSRVSPLRLGIPLADIVSSGFPVFGAFEWMSSLARPGEGDAPAPCPDELSLEFHALLVHHLRRSSAVPAGQALQYIGSATPRQLCPLGRAAALLSLALGLALQGTGPELRGDIEGVIGQADRLLQGSAAMLDEPLASPDSGWPILALLHRLASALTRPREAGADPEGCVILIYSFPTAEIKADTAVALQALEEHYFAALGVSYPLVVFTDAATAPTLGEELGRFTSARIVPAVIPESELKRHMLSYSCVDGIDCLAGNAPESSAHRGVVNKTQFWSADYLRVSRYTAGPLFLHPALDQCGVFLKIDTDFYFTAPMERDPIEEMRREGSRLGYWQIHVQGQRQAGYMEAAVGFLAERGLPILNRAFYARGRFEEKARELGIPVSEVPEALESATVVYGCLFGGEVSFFREPLYRDFFRYMDAQGGFESRGWSNQFFLGTAAAAFLFPSQVRRLYISGRHQESNISCAHGNVTEYLEGATKSVFR